MTQKGNIFRGIKIKDFKELPLYVRCMPVVVVWSFNSIYHLKAKVNIAGVLNLLLQC